MSPRTKLHTTMGISRRFAPVVHVAFTCMLGGCATVMRAPPPPSPEDSVRASVALNAVLEDHFRYIQQVRPEVAAWAGGWVPNLPDVTQDGSKRDAQFARAMLSALDRIEVEALTEDDYVSWRSLSWDMETLAGWPAYYWTRLTDASPGGVLDETVRILRRHRPFDEASGQRFLLLVERVDSLILAMHRGAADRAARGLVMPSLAHARAIEHVRSLIGPSPLSPFGLPLELPRVADSSAGTWRADLDRKVAGIVERRINPALDSLAAFFEASSRSSAPPGLGLSQYPGGRSHYQALLRFHSTVDITPEDAHALGLREVARLAVMAGRARVDARLPANRDSLRAALRRDPRYSAGGYRDSPEALLQTIGRLYENAARSLDSLFRPAPSSAIALSEMPVDEAALGPITSYEPPSVLDPLGHERINTRRLFERAHAGYAAMVYEDLVPGLHHQQARQRETGLLPPSRRVALHGGFVRGWQAYALSVADSVLGEPGTAARFGARLRELAMACGLVVDTGINALGWTREDALAFLRAHLPEDDDELEREFIVEAVERPGQLSAATLGAREIHGMRRWAEKELGDRFQLPAFHAELLRTGSVPLPVLGSHLERWLWERRADEPQNGARP